MLKINPSPEDLISFYIMGNLINPSAGSNSFFLDPIIPSIEPLANWKKNAIISFHRTYLSLFPLSIYLSYPEFSKLLSLFISAQEVKEIFDRFKFSSTNTLNILEIISTLITYSCTELEDKISLAFKIFDFDHSSKLNPDEFQILCLSFIKGIKRSTDSSILFPVQDDKLLLNFHIENKLDSDMTQQE